MRLPFYYYYYYYAPVMARLPRLSLAWWTQNALMLAICIIFLTDTKLLQNEEESSVLLLATLCVAIF